MPKTKSGKYWVDWANTHAKNSQSVDDLADPFKANAKAFIKALEDAGAKVKVSATKRDAKRAYLFHWSWLIALDKSKPSAATAMAGVDIEWDHGDAAKSKAGRRKWSTGSDWPFPRRAMLPRPWPAITSPARRSIWISPGPATSRSRRRTERS